MRRFILLTGLVVGWTAGCGTSSHNPNLDPRAGAAGDAGAAGTPSDGGKGGKGGSSHGGSGGASGGASGTTGGTSSSSSTTEVNSLGAPTLTFVSPASVTDPNATGVITSGQVTVACKAVVSTTPGSSVDPASAIISMSQYGSTITTAQVSTRMVSGARESVFALNDSTGVKSGPVQFECTAQDNSSPPLIGKADTLNLLVDRGPTITLAAPSGGQNIALGAGVDVDFNVDAQPIAGGDQKFNLDTVTVTINGKKVTVNETSAGSGHYASHVTLTDPAVFPAGDTPDGTTTLQVVAANQRGTTVQKTTTFTVDSRPPTISISDPKQSTVIGKTTLMTFTVDDAGAGVNESLVGVRINAGTTFFYTDKDAARWDHLAGNSTYKFTFSDADFPTSTSQVTISISATDKVGNSITPGATVAYFVDTTPPYLNLDPPTIREFYYESGIPGQVYSNAYDPLGEAINDLTIVQATGQIFRALAWDLTNPPPESNQTYYYSGVKSDSVTLYMQEDVTGPLLIDTDGDGFCDDIDVGTGDKLKPAIMFGEIAPAGDPPWIYPKGTAVFTDGDDTRYGPAPTIGDSEWQGWAKPPAYYLCSNQSDMVRALKHPVTSAKPVPVIYGINTVADPTNPDCTGTYWAYGADMKRTVKEGWICFAARAYDGVGNRGISPPLRLCYDEPGNGTTPDCAASKQPLSTTFNNAWKSYITHGSVTDLTFRSKSAATPPSCTTNCKVPTQSLDRSINGQAY